MHRCLLLVVLAACAPPESAWERTRAVCGDDGWGSALDPTLSEPDPDGTIDATLPSLDCLETIAADLSVDVEGFEARDGIDREVFLEPIRDADRFSGLAFPLYAARLLLTNDLGRVGDVEAGLLVQGDFVKRLRKAGGGRRWQVQEALYQRLVDDIDALVPASEELEARVAGEGVDVRTSWRPELNRLSVYEAGWPAGYGSLGAIVHELRHDDGPVHVDLRGRAGDISANGSFGWQASAQTLVWRGLSEEDREAHGEAMALWVTDALLRIERWRGSDGELVQPWDGFPFND